MPTRDILVISDLHLGEDLRPGSDADVGLDALETELVSFLDHYREGKPVQLVINGDMLDLVSASMMPASAELLVGLDPGDHHYGLGSRALAAVTKIRAVAARHDAFFTALARFVGRGHDVALVMGNHDAELHWPVAQKALVDCIAERWARDPAPGRTEAELREAIAFHPWFYFEDGAVWVEHGHQYDGYCSFDYVLDPSDPTSETELEQNVGTAAMRYIGNHMVSQPEAEADKSFVHYVQLIFNSGQGWLMWSGYWAMTWALTLQWMARMRRPEAFEARKARHRELMARQAIGSRLTEETLHKLFDLRTRPVFVQLSRLVTALMLGRLVLTLGAVAAVPLLMATVPWVYQPLALAVWASWLLGGHLALASGRENVDPRQAMERAAGRIRDLVRAPVVVFGHSHHAAAHRIEKNAWYFNTGTWLGEPGVRTFTHLLIERRPGALTARLCRWIDGQSRELRAEHAPVPVLAGQTGPQRRPGSL